jgi:hypothetical protein
MSDTTASLRRKIGGAGDLQSVVRTMKALAASSIGQYEKSVRALGDYYRTVELGLGMCLRESGPAPGTCCCDTHNGVVSGQWERHVAEGGTRSARDVRDVENLLTANPMAAIDRE